MVSDVALGTFELSDPEFWLAPRDYRDAAFRSLRAADELVFFDEWEFEGSPLPKGPGYWAITRYEDVWAASRNPQVLIELLLDLLPLRQCLTARGIKPDKVMLAAIRRIHGEGHDALVEPFVPGHDIEVSVVTLDGEPYILPTQIVEQDDPWQLRTYQEKRNLVGGQAYPSISLAKGRIYISSDNGTTIVLEPGREYKELARNTLEPFRSSLVFDGKRMYVRTTRGLWCIGE